MRLWTILLAAALLLSAACARKSAELSLAKKKIETALHDAVYDNIKVNEDRKNGVIRLSGNVPSLDDKDKVGQIAEEAADGIVVANEVGVRPQGDEKTAEKVDQYRDAEIENHMKAELAERKWDNIHVHSKNHVLTLEGDVNSFDMRQQVDDVATKVPGVHQVVNLIKVKTR